MVVILERWLGAIAALWACIFWGASFFYFVLWSGVTVVVVRDFIHLFVVPLLLGLVLFDMEPDGLELDTEPDDLDG